MFLRPKWVNFESWGHNVRTFGTGDVLVVNDVPGQHVFVGGEEGSLA